MSDFPTTSAFPETADIETSSDDYARRFSGATGQWMLDTQEHVTLSLLGKDPSIRTVLDVGGGHGQLAIPAVAAGLQVTILGSAPECVHRVRSIVDPGKATFVVGNVIALPFPDQSFDAVLCFRLITHCEQWPVLVRELCRVAKRCVIVDYPTSQSLNAIAPALFGAKKKFEKNTRTWTLFKHAQLRDEFGKHGFAMRDRVGQFFFPMVIHRMLKLRAVSAAMEAVSRVLGLNALAGSPVIARFERNGG